MRMVTANGLNLVVREDGTHGGPAIVFANSLGTDHRVFDALLPFLPKTLHIVRYDKRGHGLSDAPPPPYRMEDHVADLAAILDALKVKKAAMVGLSIGGAIGLGLAARRPDLVSALVLMDSAHKIGTAEMWNGRIDAIRKGGIAAIADAIMERWFSPTFRSERKADLALYRNMLTRTTLDGYVGSCMALRDVDYEGEAKALRIPVLAMAGSVDLATPPDLVRGTAGIIRDSRFVMIEGCGHLPCVEEPETVAAAITGFLKEHHLG
jgi:3-oxoadipate enol-lactonase